MADNNTHIPKHWKTVSLTDDLPYIKTGVSEYIGKKKYFSTGSIKSDSLIAEGEYEFNEKPSRANRIVKKGDVLQARMKNTDKAILIDSKLDGQLFSTGFFQIRANETNVNSKFIFYYLQSLNFKKTKDGLCSGSTQEALNDNGASKILIPLPPFEEQKKIVLKIEEIISDLDNGIRNIETARLQLAVYRQSLLKWAFSGKLTSKTENEELPKDWKIATLGEVSEMCLGKMLDKKKNKGNYQPYLRNISVRWGHFDLTDLEEMRFEPHEEERYSLKNGDLIVCEGGEPGRCAIWKGEVPNMKIQKALHRVRVKKMLSEIYLYHFMCYSAMSGLLNKYFTGTTIKHLTGRELKKIEIPLPPKKEQQSIIDELESKLTICDKIEETISQSLLQAETLKQSILKKAFEGQLVNTEILATI
jgi:type I restriction enzyme S subunit